MPTQTPDNPITQGSYWPVTPGAEFTSKAYGNLSGTDLFFFVTTTQELRVVNFTTDAPGNTSFVLALAARWVGALSMAGVVHVYYADLSGQMWHIPYSILGGPFSAASIPITQVNNFSVTYTPQSTPPAFMMITDDGVFHTLYVNNADDPAFGTPLAPPLIVYNNALAPTVFVTQPTITMHPLDTVNLTVAVQQINQMTDVSEVGFYAVVAPGVS